MLTTRGCAVDTYVIHRLFIYYKNKIVQSTQICDVWSEVLCGCPIVKVYRPRINFQLWTYFIGLGFTNSLSNTTLLNCTV